MNHGTNKSPTYSAIRHSNINPYRSDSQSWRSNSANQNTMKNLAGSQNALTMGSGHRFNDSLTVSDSNTDQQVETVPISDDLKQQDSHEVVCTSVDVQVHLFCGTDKGKCGWWSYNLRGLDVQTTRSVHTFNVDAVCDMDLYDRSSFSLRNMSNPALDHHTDDLGWMGNIHWGNGTTKDVQSGHFELLPTLVMDQALNAVEARVFTWDGKQWCLRRAKADKFMAFYQEQGRENIALTFKYHCEEYRNNQSVPDTMQAPDIFGGVWNRRLVRLNIHVYRAKSKYSNSLIAPIVDRLDQFQQSFFDRGYGCISARTELNLPVFDSESLHRYIFSAPKGREKRIHYKYQPSRAISQPLPPPTASVQIPLSQQQQTSDERVPRSQRAPTIH